MIMDTRKQISETMTVGILLAVTGGLLDAYSYIIRGHVFANAETGNMVLMGINIAEGNYVKALYYLYPILAFALGIIVAEVIKKKYKGNNEANFHWRQIVIAMEMLIVVIVGFIPVGPMDPLANILIAFICSMQVQTFRRFHGNLYATTMCTGNLRSGTEHLSTYIHFKDTMALKKAVQYYGIIISFIGGAALGVFATGRLDRYSVLLALINLVIVFVMMFIK